MPRLAGARTRELPPGDHVGSPRRDAAHRWWLAAAALLSALAVVPEVEALSVDEARHLLARTGFGADVATLQQLLPLSREQAVDSLLARVRTAPGSAPPRWVGRPLAADEEASREVDPVRQLQYRRRHVKAWWVQEMVRTDSPLTERMTLLWHGHFTSSLRKVKDPELMYRQNLLLRRHALGSFRELLGGVARDPAMLVYLDNRLNLARQPNENFARELLELFTLGEGHYAEADVREAARAFSGWGIDESGRSFRFHPRRHDGGEKRFLGHAGDLDGDDVLAILLEQERTALTVAEKFWREFVSEQPEPGSIAGLARVLREHDYELAPLLRAVLLSEPFWDPRNRGILVKSPAELVVGTVRLLGVRSPSWRVLARAMVPMGQSLMDPPSVAGWAGGRSWIDTGTLVARERFLRRLSRGRRVEEIWPYRFAAALRRDDLPPLLLPVPPVRPPEAEASLDHALQSLLLDPAYHLK